MCTPNSNGTRLHINFANGILCNGYFLPTNEMMMWFVPKMLGWFCNNRIGRNAWIGTLVWVKLCIGSKSPSFRRQFRNFSKNRLKMHRQDYDAVKWKRFYAHLLLTVTVNPSLLHRKNTENTLVSLERLN